jgi:thiol-disulfide isomerase/thioredoxin
MRLYHWVRRTPLGIGPVLVTALWLTILAAASCQSDEGTSNTALQTEDTATTDTPPQNPPVVDDDDDGLSNADEAALGTDSTNPDTDGDGYLDGHEVQAGTNPLDSQDVIYIGGWPYNPNKASFPDPGLESQPAVGARLARHQLIDQYGQMVDLYDFIGQGKPVILDVGTKYCKPCKGLAAFLSTGDPSAETDNTSGPANSYAWWKDEYTVIRDMIDNDEIYWITVLWSSCGPNGTPAKPSDGVAWHEEWPHHKIPVLVDVDCAFKEHLQVGAMPHIDVLDEALVFLVYHTGGPVPALKALLEMSQ